MMYYLLMFFWFDLLTFLFRIFASVVMRNIVFFNAFLFVFGIRKMQAQWKGVVKSFTFLETFVWIWYFSLLSLLDIINEVRPWCGLVCVYFAPRPMFLNKVLTFQVHTELSVLFILLGWALVICVFFKEIFCSIYVKFIDIMFYIIFFYYVKHYILDLWIFIVVLLLFYSSVFSALTLIYFWFTSHLM